MELVQGCRLTWLDKNVPFLFDVVERATPTDTQQLLRAHGMTDTNNIVYLYKPNIFYRKKFI